MSVLSNANLVRREHFDASNTEHVASFRHFVTTGSWGEIQFHAEMPYTTVPATVTQKYLLAQFATCSEVSQ